MSVDVEWARPDYAVEETDGPSSADASRRRPQLQHEVSRRLADHHPGVAGIASAPLDGRPPEVPLGESSYLPGPARAAGSSVASTVAAGAPAAECDAATDSPPRTPEPSPAPAAATPWQLAAARRREAAVAAARILATSQPWVTTGVVGVVYYADIVIGRGAAVERFTSVRRHVIAGAGVPARDSSPAPAADGTGRAPNAVADGTAARQQPELAPAAPADIRPDAAPAAPPRPVAAAPPSTPRPEPNPEPRPNRAAPAAAPQQRPPRTVRVNPCIAHVHKGTMELGFRRFRLHRGNNDFGTVSRTAGADLARTDTDLSAIFRRDPRLLDRQLTQRKYQSIAPVVALAHKMIAEENIDTAWQILYNDNSTDRAGGIRRSLPWFRRPRAHLIMITKVGTSDGRFQLVVFDSLADPATRNVRRHPWQWWRPHPIGMPMEIHRWADHAVNPKTIAAGTAFGQVSSSWHVLFLAGTAESGAVPIPITPTTPARDLPGGTRITGLPSL